MTPEIKALTAKLDSDVFIYNGPMRRWSDMQAINAVAAAKCSNKAVLILVTGGGDPDAAFKMARYFQTKYDHFTVLVPGLCKSAGTLLAIGAHQLVFTPYGELGPLDIQMSKVDRFEGMQSGLVIQDSLTTLEERAAAIYYKTMQALMTSNQGMISFATASAAAVDLMKSIYGPVLGRIDPEEIGVRARAMRIAQDYGSRLDAEGRNLKPATLTLLSEKYPSHSFVIDHSEAETLFNRVRLVNKDESAIIDQLDLEGQLARYPLGEVAFHALHDFSHRDLGEANDDQADGRGDAPQDGADPPRADAAPVAAPDADEPAVADADVGHQ